MWWTLTPVLTQRKEVETHASGLWEGPLPPVIEQRIAADDQSKLDEADAWARLNETIDRVGGR